jgi:mRNA-degrading endonuclease RelE of RelBE toxin-antitoxin system
MDFLFTAKFLRSLKKLPVGVQDDVITSVEMFKHTSNHKKLNLHKLGGRMKKYHAFSANYTHRVIIRIHKNTVYFLDVGTHDVYK